MHGQVVQIYIAYVQCCWNHVPLYAARTPRSSERTHQVHASPFSFATHVELIRASSRIFNILLLLLLLSLFISISTCRLSRIFSHISWSYSSAGLSMNIQGLLSRLIIYTTNDDACVYSTHHTTPPSTSVRIHCGGQVWDWDDDDAKKKYILSRVCVCVRANGNIPQRMLLLCACILFLFSPLL